MKDKRVRRLAVLIFVTVLFVAVTLISNYQNCQRDKDDRATAARSWSEAARIRREQGDEFTALIYEHTVREFKQRQGESCFL